MISMTFKLINLIWTDWDFFTSFIGILVILLGEFQIYSFLLILSLFYYTFTIFSMLAISATAILLIKLKQLSTVLYFPLRKGKKGRNSPSACLCYFTKHHTTTMKLIFIANKVYGKAILIFLVANWPCNIIFVVHLIAGNTTLTGYIIFITLLFQQTICMFGNHYLATMFCRTIHQPSKRLLRLDVLVKSLNTRDHLKLCHYTQMLHTRNQYGITYGNILGIITVNKFFRVGQQSQRSLSKLFNSFQITLVYFRFLLFSWRLFFF